MRRAHKLASKARELAEQAMTQTLKGLPTSLRNVLSYPAQEYAGIPARDTLKQAGDDLCEYLQTIDLTKNAMTWLRPYLLAMGGSLQPLGSVTFDEPDAMKELKPGVRQRVLITMDLLSGCLAYAVSSVQGTYSEATRRNFLLTHGRKFISSTRAKRRYRSGQADERMNAYHEAVVTTAP